jgi:hypothetical protein
MARLSPEQQIERIRKTLSAWEKEAPRSTFSGYTFTSFKAAMQPALDAHAKVQDRRLQLRFSTVERNSVVKKAMQLVYTVGFAVQGDPNHGRNSELHEALGYTREAVRRTRIRRGMRRKRAQQKAALRP